MADTTKQGKPRFLHRRYLLDRPSQLTLALWVLCVLGGVGLLHACAIYYLLGTELVIGKTVGETRLVVLLVQGGYFLVGGAIAYVTLLLLTHRYAGPALVVRRALHALRRGDVTARLSLRRRDFLKELAEEARQLRDELAEREAARREAYERLESALEAEDVVHARFLLRELREDSPEEPEPENAAA